MKQRLHAYLNKMCWLVWDELKISVNDLILNKALKRLSWNKKRWWDRQLSEINNCAMTEFSDWVNESLSSWYFWMKVLHTRILMIVATTEFRSNIVFTTSQNLRRSKRWSILSVFIVNDYITWKIHQNSITAIIFNDFV